MYDRIRVGPHASGVLVSVLQYTINQIVFICFIRAFLNFQNLAINRYRYSTYVVLNVIHVWWVLYHSLVDRIWLIT